jgi:phosphoribosylanthranilate isomerase
MNLKVCGITTLEQFITLDELGVDMIGLNFYKPSKRFIDDLILPKKILENTRSKIVGVFVNHSVPHILKMKEKYHLDFAQLHGDENLEFCMVLSKDIDLIKVWRVKDNMDSSALKQYDDIVSYHLFDTFTKEYGGSGESFNWELINKLNIEKPVILSGGISISHVEQLKNTDVWGVDINSKFETKAGIKDLSLIEDFIAKINEL